MSWNGDFQKQYDEHVRIQRELREALNKEMYGPPERPHHIDCGCKKCMREE